MELIKTFDVCKYFEIGKKKIEVLKNVNCSINKSEFVVILGASGSGKTTFLNMIAGLDKPTNGNIFVNSQDITSFSMDELSLWRAKNIGVIFQSYNLMPFMSAIDNVALPLVFQGISKRQRYKKAASLLKAVGLKNQVHSSCQLLSGGEQQRVTIARALVNSPKLILADEPTGDLDTKNADEIVEILFNLYKEGDTTVVMATHNLAYTKFADRILNIKDGEMICDFKI